jgi:uncharacterized protein (TIGR00299 family) protein
MLAYFDCFAGISGDMTVAALIDLGLDQDYLAAQLATLNLSAYSLKVWRSKRGGLAGVRFEVEIESDQPHRTYKEIRNIIEECGIEQSPKAKALEILELLAVAESRVHGVDKEDVHFHEVGAVDSIIDIVAAAVGVHRLGINRVICSPLPLSRGLVRTDHGTIPTPAPATLEILKDVPVLGFDAPMEMVTPTGAAIARTFASGFGDYPDFVPLKTGYGLGKSDPEAFPNALRIVMGEEAEKSLRMEKIGVVDCAVDDLDPRVLGDLMELLLSVGALDVRFTPTQMKKNRPGTLITVLVSPEQVTEMSRILLTHTTTLGVRVSNSKRIAIPRSSEIVRTSFGEVRVKVVEMPEGRRERRVEFDEVRAIARRTGQPTRRILSTLESELNG